MKLDTYIMAPELHLNGVRHKSFQSLCFLLCIPLFLLGKDSIKKLPRQGMHAQQLKIWWIRRFLRGPCRIKGT
jgi:hypothetical protein